MVTLGAPCHHRTAWHVHQPNLRLFRHRFPIVFFHMICRPPPCTATAKHGPTGKNIAAHGLQYELSTLLFFCMSCRTCRIKNFCYNPKTEDFFIVRSNTTVLHSVPTEPDEALLDLTSLSDHGVFFFKYTEVREHMLQNQTIQLVDEPTFILDRFHPGNIMHAIHDDLIGLYFQLKMHAPPTRQGPYESAAAACPFSKQQHILFMDGFLSGDYGKIFSYLSDYPIRFKADLSNETITCFREAYVGQSKEANWYQYGFSEPQGPIANKTVSGYRLREVGNYVMHSLGLPTWDRSAMVRTLQYLRERALHADARARATGAPEEAYIAIFSRRQDRLIVNENDMAAQLQAYYGLPVVFIRNEDMSFEEQVRLLRRAVIGIGMHGSLLVMGMFMPPGAVLIELYPYAVPADNYTPYNTMARLHGMEMVYRSWTNTHIDNNIPHPEYPEHHGGLASFSKEKQESILNATTVPSHLCCTDPYWLFRIYQDTIVDMPELLAIATDAIIESSEHMNVSERLEEIHIVPAMIKNTLKWSLVVHASDSNETQLPPPVIALTWDAPWNVRSVEKYGIWVHQTYQEYYSTEPSILLTDVCDRVASNATIEIWVRSYFRDERDELVRTEWGSKLECHCSSENMVPVVEREET